MMFGWYEMDLALGRVRDIPPLQGVGFYVAVFPGRCPELSHCAPLGRKTGALLGPKTGASLGACEGHSAPLGRGVLCGRFPRALPWAITLCPVGAEDRCPFWGRKTGAPLGAVDVIGSKNYHPARVCGTAHMRLFHCRDSIRCSTFCCISSLS